jgi:uncharacterized protein YjiS (DUF1127 family)
MSFQSRNRLTLEQDLFATPAVAVTPPSLRDRLAVTIAVWRERTMARRCLAAMNARSLRDAGISPAAAAFESGKPFWQKLGGLR